MKTRSTGTSPTQEASHCSGFLKCSTALDTLRSRCQCYDSLNCQVCERAQTSAGMSAVAMWLAKMGIQQTPKVQQMEHFLIQRVGTDQCQMGIIPGSHYDHYDSVLGFLTSFLFSHILGRINSPVVYVHSAAGSNGRQQMPLCFTNIISHEGWGQTLESGVPPRKRMCPLICSLSWWFSCRRKGTGTQVILFSKQVNQRKYNIQHYID